MLDLSCVEFSKWDKRNSVKIPKEITPKLAEEVGLHIGDGCLIQTNSNLHMYSLRGHAIDDKEFYSDYIPKLYFANFNLPVKIRVWPDVIGFQTFSKALGTFKSNVLGLPLGPKKEITIPEMFCEKDLLPHVIRGIFDTDGCINFEKKNSDKPYYPRVLISTTSKSLAEQLTDIFVNNFEFTTSTWKSGYKNRKWKPLYRICTRGGKNFNNWFKSIGSNNPKNQFKYTNWKNHGYASVAQ